jgi:CheY-like chemotaxis protein
MSKIRVLLVDDHLELRRLIRLTLDSDRYEIHEADNGQDALRLARAMRPDIVLMDVMMPGELDGLQVCEAIRADSLLRNSRVILLSARAQATDRAAGMRAGADAYLTKPFSPLELCQVVDNIEVDHAGDL